MVEAEKNSVNGPALIYCRVSTHSLAKGTSLESQRAACIAHAERLGYTVACLTEEVFSGAELFGRPKLLRDRVDIRAGIFKAVVVYSVDRLTRNPVHLAILSDECDRAGCRMVFVTAEEGFTPADEAYAAEVERLKLSERVSRGRRARLLQGLPVFTGWDLYGYRPNSEAGVWCIYEPEATVVRRIFSMCAAGRGMHSIASAFNRERMPSPKSVKRPGARWSSAAISDILNNRSYMGEEVCWKTKRGARKRDFPRPAQEQIRLPEGVRPAIVPRELWEECQQRIRERAARMSMRRECVALLRGHIYCGGCGAGMVRNHFKRGKYEYVKYRCGSRWRPFAADCRCEAVPLETMHEWVWSQIKSILSAPDTIERAIDEHEKAGPAYHLISDLRTVRAIRGRAARGLEALLSKLRSDPTLRPYLEREVTQASRELRQFDETIAELGSRIGSANKGVDDLRDLRDLRARQSLDDFDFDAKRLALRALGLKVYANGDDPARWRYEVGISLRDRMTSRHDELQDAVTCEA